MTRELKDTGYTYIFSATFLILPLKEASYYVLIISNSLEFYSEYKSVHIMLQLFGLTN